MTADDLEEAVAEAMAGHFARLAADNQRMFERLRGDLLSKMLELRTPRFVVNQKGELYVGGEFAGDLRPVFHGAVSEALKSIAMPKSGDDDDGPG